MKKIFTGICAVAAMALIGCSQEEQQFWVNETNESFSGVMEVNESRTTLGDDGKVVWSEADAISIFKKSGYHQKYQVENGGSIEATFKYAGESARHGLDLTQNYSVYPYSAGHTLTEAGVFTLDLSSLATQNYTENSFEDEKSVMTAKSTDTNLFFYNALSMIRFKLWSEVPGDYRIASITLTSASNILNGTATVDMSEDKPVAKFTAGEYTTSLSCADPVVLEAGGSLVEGVATGGHDFYMMVPAGTFAAEDLTIRIEGTDGNGNGLVYEVEYPEELTLERSKIFTIYKKFSEEVWTGSIETGWDGITATPITEENNVYEITTPAELAWVASEVNSGNNTFSGKTVKLMNNIELSNKNWTPIGGSNGKRFQGIFDGGNNTISNLFIQQNRKYGSGLFGDIIGGAIIKNLTVSNAVVRQAEGSDYDYSGNIYGIVCGYAYGNVTFDNVHVRDSELHGYGKVAPILAMAADPGGVTTIKNCSVKNTRIYGVYNVAGLIGLAQNEVSLQGNNSVDAEWVKASEEKYITLINETAKDVTSGKTLVANGIYWCWTSGNMVYLYTGWADYYSDYTVADDKYMLSDGKRCIAHGVCYDAVSRYDATTKTYSIDSADALLAMSGKSIENGATIVLLEDIDMKNQEFKGMANVYNGSFTFDGKKKTISNIKLATGGQHGLFPATGLISVVGIAGVACKVEVKDLTVDNATLAEGSGKWAGTIIGYAQGENTLTNVTVVNSNLDGTKKVGGLVGFVEASGTLKAVECSVERTKVKASEKQAGGLIGYTAGTTLLSQCSVVGNTIESDGAKGDMVGEDPDNKTTIE